MARKKRYVVRVWPTEQQLEAVSNLVECLRYAGLINLEEEGDEYYIDLICPHGLVSEVWAKHNVQRMATFGWKAEVVEVQ